MKVKEAYKVFDLPENSTQDEIKRQYRSLSKQFHPDLNKDPGSENKFKSINEAFEVLKTGKSSDIEDRHYHQQQQSPFNPFSAGFGGFHVQQQEQVEHIEVKTTISFKESILGCKKDLSYSRQIKCKDCNGQGEIALNNNCQKCGGKGQTTTRRGNMMFVISCPSCNGRSETKDCIACNLTGSLGSETSIQVSIPGGVSSGNTLRLQSIGNFAGNGIFGGDNYSDVFCHITVEKDDDLVLEGQDVVSHLSLPLIDVLQGCQKTVKTIDGNKEIDIPQRSKNKDEVIIPKCGVKNVGNQRVILDVHYPDDLSELINVLQKVDI